MPKERKMLDPQPLEQPGGIDDLIMASIPETVERIRRSLLPEEDECGIIERTGANRLLTTIYT